MSEETKAGSGLSDQFRRLLEEIAEAAQEHPLFLGWPDEISIDGVNLEGGDAAFVTADIAWRAKEALEALDRLTFELARPARVRR